MPRASRAARRRGSTASGMGVKTPSEASWWWMARTGESGWRWISRKRVTTESREGAVGTRSRVGWMVFAFSLPGYYRRRGGADVRAKATDQIKIFGRGQSRDVGTE